MSFKRSQLGTNDITRLELKRRYSQVNANKDSSHRRDAFFYFSENYHEYMYTEFAAYVNVLNLNMFSHEQEFNA